MTMKDEPVMVIEIPNYIREIKVANKRRDVPYMFENGYVVTNSTCKIRQKMLTSIAKQRLKQFPNSLIKATDLNSLYTIGAYTPNGLADYVIDKVTMKTIKGRVLDSTQLKATTKLKVIEVATKQPTLANENVAGKPKFKIINGQDIYNGNVREHLRAFMMLQIKLDMVTHITKYLESLPVREKYHCPLIMEIELHDVIDKGNWDIGNRIMPYDKAFLDLIRSGIIKDNNKKEIKIFDPPFPDDNVMYITKSGGCLFTPIEDTNNRKLIFKFYEDKRDVITSNPRYQKTHNVTTKQDVQYALFA